MTEPQLPTVFGDVDRSWLSRRWLAWSAG